MKLLITGGSGFIGTNLIENMVAGGHSNILNLDLMPPLDSGQEKFWRSADILDRETLEKEVRAFSPSHVIHLAARTDCVEDTTVEEGYQTNTAGTQNLLDVLKCLDSVSRLIITSTQFVCGPGYESGDMWDYAPHTVYGRSKCISEELTRSANLDFTWLIIRPVNIWGPWHLRYRNEFWRVLASGLYLHPSGPPVVRTYGYVGNVVWQIGRLFEVDARLVAGKAFYVGDSPGDIYGWVNEFSLALMGKNVKKVPRVVLYSLGLFGDMLALAGVKFPITRSRYRSMTSDYATETRETEELLGRAPWTVSAGVVQTSKWLDSYR